MLLFVTGARAVIPIASINHQGPHDFQGEFGSLASLIGVSPDAIALTDINFKFVYRNAACCELVSGLPKNPDLAILTDFIDEADRQAVHFALARLRLLPAKSQRTDIRVVNPDGSRQWMLLRLSAFSTSETGEIRQLFAQMTDITDQKNVEFEMLASEERWNSALVSSQLGVWDHNFKTGDFYYSNTWKTLRGIPHDEAVDPEMESWISNVHPDDRALVLDVIGRQNRGELNYSQFEYRERHRLGHWVWIECRGACIEWDAKGLPSRIVGTDTDITARKSVEEELQMVTRRLELALEVTSIGVFEADIDKDTCHWDERMLSIFGVENGDVVSEARFWNQMIHPEDREAAVGKINENIAAKTAFTNEFRIIRPDGSIRHIRASVTPVARKGEDGRFIGANWDVTDDVLIRQELEQAKTLAETRNRELEAIKVKVEHDSLHDFLTDLPNRRYLDAKLQNWSKTRTSGGKGLAVMHLDLDRFKQINDTFGHKAGDSVLRHVAELLRNTAGVDDFIARIGGDEFVILSPWDGSKTKFTWLAETIIRKLRQPTEIDGHACRIGASIGIAIDEGTQTSAGQLLLNSDLALYHAKSSGRNRFEFYSAAIQNAQHDAKKLGDELLEGIERGEIFPVYQLQFNANDLSVSGVESLARWNHPTKGYLTPDRFLKIAEDLDMVATIDAIILDHALADFAIWQDRGIAIPKVSVNVSSRRLSDPGFIGKLAHLDIAPGTVSFELLESTFLDDCDEIVSENLAHIRERGIDVEIDDFGTGHASIISLLKIGPGSVKIARELVCRIAETQEERNIVKSIIEIGKSLNISVIAEGAETPEQIRILQELGCNIIQGFGLARPMPFNEIAAFVGQKTWLRAS